MALHAERFLVWGGGGHGRVVADLVRSTGGDVLGFVDRNPAATRVPDSPGDQLSLAERDFLQLLDSGEPLVGGCRAIALGIGDNRMRIRALSLLNDSLVRSLVHPSAVVSPSAEIGPGSVVLPNAVLNAGARVGRGVIVNTGAIIEHDCQIGDGAHISPGAVLAGGVSIGARTWVGAGATVIQGLVIGPDCMIGAGAVVLRDVPAGVTSVGNPARVVNHA